ncbi:MAG: hypothetical protein EPO06_07990 [Burkholderiaceae bacterium]|nr:MAG: hypothetical protein EPO06_07990 [Burkholderiaceae bacterium]
MKLSRTSQAVFDSLLKDLLEKASGLQAASISSIDGFQIAMAPATHGRTTGKMAAMSSSLHALGQALTREAKCGHCRSLAVQGDKGFAIVIEIPGQNPPLLLNLITHADSDLARLLQVAQACAKRIADKLALMQ